MTVSGCCAQKSPSLPTAGSAGATGGGDAAVDASSNNPAAVSPEVASGDQPPLPVNNSDVAVAAQSVQSAPDTNSQYNAQVAADIARADIVRGGGASSTAGADPTNPVLNAPMYDDSRKVAANGSAPRTGGVVAADGANQLNGYTPELHERFLALDLAPADIEFLATGGFSTAELEQVAAELEQVPVLDPRAPVTAGTPVDGPSPSGANDGFVQQQGSGWNSSWESKFRETMQDMGLPKTEIDSQIREAAASPLTNEQLEKVHSDMVTALGDWDDGWKSKFTTLFGKLEVPKEQQEEALVSLAGQGLSDAQLQDSFDKMEAQLPPKPAWNDQWDKRFSSLQIPEELHAQFKDSGAGEEQLQEAFDNLINKKMEFRENGRLEKLTKAGADDTEKWGIILADDMSDKDFDKTVESIKSSNVPMWKRGLSMAVNLIPGVGTVQYLLGKDFVTGEKIDRSNPLNIGMAILSAIPVATTIRGGMQAVKGAGMLTTALKAGTAGSATTQALQGAGTLGKFTAGLSTLDKAKFFVPVVRNIGTTGQLFTASRGFYQGTQALAASAALRTGADGAKYIDDAVKTKVFDSLKSGASVDDALSGVVRGGGDGRAVMSAKELNAFREGTTFTQRGGIHRFNPFSNKSGVTATNVAGEGGGSYTAVALGRNTRPDNLAGLAQIHGATKAAQYESHLFRAGLAAASQTGDEAARTISTGIRNSENAVKLSRIDPKAIQAMGLENASIARWGDKLGVASGGKFRSLLQLDESSRAVRGLTRQAANLDSGAANSIARWAGTKATQTIGLTAGTVGFTTLTGQAGQMVQPAWDQYKIRDEIAAEQATLDQAAEDEYARLDQINAENIERQAGTAQPAPATEAGSVEGAGMAAAEQPQPAGPTAAGSQGSGVVIDPQSGWYVDTTTGYMADPSTGQVIDPSTGQLVGTLDPAALAGLAPTG